MLCAPVALLSARGRLATRSLTITACLVPRHQTSRRSFSRTLFLETDGSPSDESPPGQRQDIHAESPSRNKNYLSLGNAGPPGSAQRARFIEKALSHRRPRPGASTFENWIMRSSVSACQDLVPVKLRPDPLAYFATSERSPDIAGRCLDYYIVQQHQSLASRSQARDRFRKDQAGRRALLWCLRNFVYDEHDFKLHPRFIRGLVHCLVAEGLLKELLDFIRLTPAPSKLPNLTLAMSRGWKGDMVSDLIRCTTFWADDMNTAVELLVRLCENRTSAAEIPVPQALSSTVRKLVDRDPGEINPEIYDRFCENFRILSRPGYQHAFDYATLTLHHPTRPTPDDLIAFLCDIAESGTEDPFVQDLTNPSDRKRSSILYYKVIRAAVLVHEQGKTEDAKTLLEYAIDKYPIVFRQSHGIARVEEKVGMLRPKFDVGFINLERSARVRAARRDMYSTVDSSRDHLLPKR